MKFKPPPVLKNIVNKLLNNNTGFSNKALHTTAKLMDLYAKNKPEQAKRLAESLSQSTAGRQTIREMHQISSKLLEGAKTQEGYMI